MFVNSALVRRLSEEQQVPMMLAKKALELSLTYDAAVELSRLPLCSWPAETDLLRERVIDLENELTMQRCLIERLQGDIMNLHQLRS